MTRTVDIIPGHGPIVRRHAFGFQFNQTRPDAESGQRRLIWTPSMGEDLRGPLMSDPAFARILDAEPLVLNNIADNGEDYLLDAGFRQATQETAIYGALFNDTPVDGDDLTTLTGEPSGNGYARLTYNCNGTDFPTLTGGVMTGAQKTYTASGGSIGPVTYFCFVGSLAGTTEELWAYAALSQSRTLADGDSLNVTPSITLS